MAKVSILMNAYNSEIYLKEAIDSIYAQTYSDWEIIFIDNCSTDRTKEIAKSYDERLKYYKTDYNTPLGEARNWGLQYCNSEYLAFLDTDDIWLKDKLQIQIDELEKNQEAKLCYGGVVTIDKDGKEIDKMLPIAKSGMVFAQQLIRYEVNMQSVVIRNDIDISFNSEMKFSPDFDLFLKIMSNYPTIVISDYLAKYRKLQDSLTSKLIDRWWIETKMTLDSIFREQPSLKDDHNKEYKFAYAKNNYYQAQYLVSVGEIKDARTILSKYKFLSLRYFILYSSLLFSLSFWKFIHRFK